VRFTWDSDKRDSNLSKHGLDFADAPELFSGVTETLKDERFDYGEHRFITLGMLKDVVVVVAHTETDEEIRVISMRKATRNEQEKYYQKLADRFPARSGDEG
jgi:uncharacterized DUF497 family protein